MRAEIDKVAQKIPISLSTYNIRDDSLPDVQHWRRLYQYDIPVLHLDGQGTNARIKPQMQTKMSNQKHVRLTAEIFRHRVTAEALLSRLESQDAGSV